MTGLHGTAGPESNTTGAKDGSARFLRMLLKGWRVLAGFIGRVNTVLLLGAVFFLVVTPIGLVLRMLRKEMPLRGSAFWTRRPEGGDMERQF